MRASEIRTWLVTEIGEYVPAAQRKAFLNELGPELRALFGRSASDRETWTPLAHFVQTLEAADRVTAKGDLASCWEIGRFTATHEVGVVRAFALKVFRPAIVMSLSASLWQVHYKNAGRVVSQIVGTRALNFSIVDYPSPHRAHCLAVGGWAQGALELGPRRAVRVQKTACRCEGGLTCDYRVSWEEA